MYFYGLESWQNVNTLGMSSTSFPIKDYDPVYQLKVMTQFHN